MSEVIKVKARHFKGKVNFVNFLDCPLARAAKEQFKTGNVSEGVYEIEIDGETIGHELYGQPQFTADFKKANFWNKFGFGFITLRKVRLYERETSSHRHP